MPIYLSESDVRGLLDMKAAIRALEDAFKAQASGKADNRSRHRIPINRGTFNVMSGGWEEKGVVGLKAYTAGANGASFHILLYDAAGGDGLLAVIEAGFLGKVRTGAATGLATRLLGSRETGRAAIVGAGNQAESQLEALVAVGHAQSACVYSPTAARREKFAGTMSEKLGIEVTPVSSVEAAVDGADSVTLITNSRRPVLSAAQVRPGIHVNCAGNNTWLGEEIDPATISHFDSVVVDSIDQARIESGELMRAAETGGFNWSRAIALGDVVAGLRAPRSSGDQTTLFKSLGVGLEDVAVAHYVYEQATKREAGVRVGP